MGNDGLRARTLVGRSGSDDLQTPPSAIRPLLPYVPAEWTVWECASGAGNLVGELQKHACEVLSSDIMDGPEHDFLTWSPDEHWDCIITNPPYSIKRKFVERCVALGRPWALLMPVAVLGNAWAQRVFAKHGVEVVFLDKRVNFTGGGGSWFSVAWYTNGLNIGAQMTWAKLPNDTLTAETSFKSSNQ